MISIFIPAKSTSTRVPNKNVLSLGGTSLLSHAVTKAYDAYALLPDESLQNFRVIIDSDSEEYYKVLTQELEPNYLLNTTFMYRPEFISDNISDVVRYELEQYPETKIAVHIHTTSPFLLASSIASGIEQVSRALNSGNTNLSAFSAKEVARFDWKYDQTQSYLVPLYDTVAMPRSQDITKTYEETHGFYVFTPEHFYATGQRFSNTPIPVLISKKEAIDIDDREDVEFARAVYSTVCRSDI